MTTSVAEVMVRPSASSTGGSTNRPSAAISSGIGRRFDMSAPHSNRVMRSPNRSEEHTSELQSRSDLVCRLLLEKKKTKIKNIQDKKKKKKNRKKKNKHIIVYLLSHFFIFLFFIILFFFFVIFFFFFFFNDTATTEIYTLSLHDALPIFHAIQYLLGRQSQDKLERFRAYGG